jgi:hypothetical protein
VSNANTSAAMTVADLVTSLSERWLRERTFELIVAPAIADLQYDDGGSRLERARNNAAVVSAFAWGLYEDITSDPGGILTFGLLALIPAVYYTMFVAICAPVPGRPMTYPLSESGVRLAIGLAVFALSLGPVLVCYWPERTPRRIHPDRS